MHNKIVYGLISFILLLLGFTMYSSFTTPKVTYVRSADLIYGYQGMKEAQIKQQATEELLKSRLDTLQMDLQKSVSQYNKDYPSLSKQERTAREELLNLQQNNFRNYSIQVEKEVKEEDKKHTEGVLNQVNAFVEEYAKNKGYDIILGTTTSGNILYAKDRLDITQEVLEALNSNYKKKL